MRQNHRAFEDSQAHYKAAVQPGSIHDTLVNEAYPPAEQWYVLADKSYIPMLLTGDHAGARNFRIASMNPLFRNHKLANDKLATFTGSWIPALEQQSTQVIHERKIELLVVFFAILAILAFLGFAITRSIVQPVHKCLAILNSMTAGDLSQTL